MKNLEKAFKGLNNLQDSYDKGLISLCKDYYDSIFEILRNPKSYTLVVNINKIKQGADLVEQFVTISNNEGFLTPNWCHFISSLMETFYFKSEKSPIAEILNDEPFEYLSTTSIIEITRILKCWTAMSKIHSLMEDELFEISNSSDLPSRNSIGSPKRKDKGIEDFNWKNLDAA